MLCGMCKAKEATVFYTEIINGTKREQYLCEECAAKSTSMRLQAPFGGQDFSLGGLLSGLFEGAQPKEEDGEQSPQAGKELTCSNCGMTYAEFKERGQFGCASCYRDFGRILLRNMRNIQGSDVHTGKRPKNAAVRTLLPQEDVPELNETERLSMQLEQAIEREEYELAAALRDQIRERKKQEAKSSDE